MKLFVVKSNFFIIFLLIILFTQSSVFGMTIQQFFDKRPDIPTNITKWSGHTDPNWILREWVKITTERGKDYKTALEILQNTQQVPENSDNSPGNTSEKPANDNSDAIDDNNNSPNDFSDGFGEADDNSPGNHSLRPKNDNGWGVHWFPTCSQSKSEVDRFTSKLKQLHIKWVLFLNQGTDMSSNDYLVDKLGELNIMPVMRLYYSTIYNPSGDEISKTKALVKHYLSKGVSYYQIYNEPNLPCEWDGGKLPENSIQKWADAFIPRAQAVIDAGGIPGIGGPAFGYIKTDGSFGNGSEYFKGMIQELIKRNQKQLLQKCVVVIHNYTTNSDPSDKSQREKFWQFETYHEILKANGLDLSMIGGEGGTRPEDVNNNQEDLANKVIWCYDYMKNAPDYLLCFSHWLLVSPDGNEWQKHSMYKNSGEELESNLVKKMEAANPPVK